MTRSTANGVPSSGAPLNPDDQPTVEQPRVIDPPAELCERFRAIGNRQVPKQPDVLPEEFFKIGETIELGGFHFVIVDAYGGGGFGITYKVRQADTDAVKLSGINEFALKISRHDIAAQADASGNKVTKKTQALVEEGHTAMLLSCENIVKTFFVIRTKSVAPKDGKAIYGLLMEYVPGGDLASKIDRRSPDHRDFTRAEKISILRGLAKAIQYVHHRGMIHSDVKPPNVLLDVSKIVRGGEAPIVPKLADFGSSKTIYHNPAAAQGTSIAGTPSYMPLHVFENLEFDAAADLYAFATTAFEVVTGGRLPYEPRALDMDARIDQLKRQVPDFALLEKYSTVPELTGLITELIGMPATDEKGEFLRNSENELILPKPSRVEIDDVVTKIQAVYNLVVKGTRVVNYRSENLTTYTKDVPVEVVEKGVVAGTHVINADGTATRLSGGGIPFAKEFAPNPEKSLFRPGKLASAIMDRIKGAACYALLGHLPIKPAVPVEDKKTERRGGTAS